MQRARPEEVKSPYRLAIDYANSLDTAETLAAEERAYSLLHPGGRFRQLEQYVAIVPVAAHEENPETVTHAVRQYARQTKCDPFTLVLGLNWPDDTEQHQRAHALVKHSRALARDMRGTLDIRVVGEQYADPTIGRIRRDLWNAVLVAGLETGTIQSGLEMVGMNGDIDVVHMPRWTVAAIQKAMHMELDPLNWGKDVAPALPRPVPMRHATSLLHPNSSAVMLWNDWVYHEAHIGYEASYVVSMGRYAKHGGILARYKAREMSSILEAAGPHPHNKTFIPTGATVTSGRRYMWRLLENGLDAIWREGSFGANSNYRQSIDQFPDISLDRRRELIRGTSENLVNALERGADFTLAQRIPPVDRTKQNMRQELARTLPIAERMLARITGGWDESEPFASVQAQLAQKYRL